MSTVHPGIAVMVDWALKMNHLCTASGLVTRLHGDKISDATFYAQTSVFVHFAALALVLFYALGESAFFFKCAVADASCVKKVVVCGRCFVTLFLTINETLKWLSTPPRLMQESFRW